MITFARLYERLDATRSTSRKVRLLTEYLAETDPRDAAWAVWLLSGNRFKRLLGGAQLRELAGREAGLSAWLIEESYAAVGDLAETLALLLPDSSVEQAQSPPLHVLCEELEQLRDEDADARLAWLADRWRMLGSAERFLLNKMLTGGLRVGVGAKLLMRALSSHGGVEEATIAHRMSGGFEPTVDRFLGLFDGREDTSAHARPFPFFLASPVPDDPATLGPREDWLAEWKWDGIRAQLLRRRGETFIWTRGEELVTERFPEIAAAAETLPDGTVLDGEILAWRDGRPLDFGVLQRRIGRRRIGPKILAEAPVRFLAYDLLEEGGNDLRSTDLACRRRRLEALLAGDEAFLMSQPVASEDWDGLSRQREESLTRGVEGLMLKRLKSPYRHGRPRGDWWKWKIDPLTFDGVLLYAEAGHGRRASLYTSYTFGVWYEGELVTVARAYSGLDDTEIREVDRWIKRQTTERFGPVRAVPPELVFELAFEGISEAPRRKAGLSLRFPRIVRWRRDKLARDADRLQSLQGILEARRS